MRSGALKPLLAAVLVVAGTVPDSAAQGVFIGVDDDPVLGAADAKVTIIEFGDYQCPSCRAFWKDVEPRLKKEYIDTGKVKLVFRDFPSVEIHPEALLVAMAVNCSQDQGKYWKYHDKVFREQDRRGADVVRLRAADLKKWARDIGLDGAAFDACLDSNRYKDEIAHDHADGARVGIEGTPIFFVNGRLIAGAQPYARFKRVIDEELKK